MSAPNVIAVAPEAWAQTAADHIAAAIDTSVKRAGHCHLALAGGNTPKPVYALLARQQLPWEKVHIWFGDERCVPPDHDDSNHQMAKRFLDAVPAQIHRIRGEDPDRDAAAATYAAALPAQLDVVLLGMGGDGHTASIFPGQAPSGRAAVVNGPKPPPWRITLTAEVLSGARHIFVLVTGASKAAMVARVHASPTDLRALPIQLARAGVWLLDRDAAAALP